MTAESRSYFHDLARWLKLEPAREQEILQELSSHLEDRLAELQDKGLDHDQALRIALTDLGHPQHLGRALYAIHSKASWGETLLAVLPHLAFALLFALHLWAVSAWVILLLISATVISLIAWRKGQPRWLYPWLGYCLISPVVSLFLITFALGEALWSLAQGYPTPLHPIAYLGMMVYGSLCLIVLWQLWRRVVRRDWLYATLTALPFPLLVSWLLFLNANGGPFAYDSQRLYEADGATALAFLVVALATAAVYRVGRRALKVSILTVATPLLVILAAVNHAGSV
ncbi:MAG: hypothetical protein HY686_06415, partial [Chloroflexi bacterium]|nr:hypothetical protein [Chloroflexota bacterium]